MNRVDHIAGQTFHGRRGDVKNAFRYGVDYLLLNAEAPASAPWLFGRNRPNLLSVHDTDHGGVPGQGRGASWVREVLAAHDIVLAGRIDLLAQPRVLGHVFNPVAFWLCHDADGILRTVIAEVTNTYGQRHSYLCAHADLRPITRAETLTATKIFHVSPFQPVEGGYVFRFDLAGDQIGIWIDYSAGKGGLIATLTGQRRPLTAFGALAMMIRRPFGSRRVLALIYWQALRLRLKGVLFRQPPAAPETDVSR